MPFVFVIPGPLRELAGNRAEARIEGQATSIADALSLLWREHPALRDRVLTELGQVRPHVNIFVDGENIRQADGLKAPVRPGAEIIIVPAVSGGAWPVREDLGSPCEDSVDRDKDGGPACATDLKSFRLQRHNRVHSRSTPGRDQACDHGNR